MYSSASCSRAWQLPHNPNAATASIDPNAPLSHNAPVQLTVLDYITLLQNFQQLNNIMQQQQQAFNNAQQSHEAAFDLINTRLSNLPTAYTSAPAPYAPAPATSSVASKPTFNPPKEFKGKVSEVDAFISSIDTAVRLQRAALITEEDKCLYMTTFLGEGTPAQWYRGVLVSKPNILNDFADFKTAFRRHFGDSNVAFSSRAKLVTLVQTGSTASYAARFGDLVAHLDWNDQAKIDKFYDGLKEQTQNYISVIKREDRPKKYLDYVSFAIDCDDRAHERDIERGQKKKGKTFFSSNGNGNATAARW
ncbi:hypothetical protein D9757_003056 [Collybiopsis confluens]|uniref:Retrotransposon gag domain-containing protein n=1 Tax=Collybiopsis confluens TaxID=2823264 RepID=A0A8H5MEY0_9AGAR|nr:hypothetical protein D9757_003056 [Collybiopsis confluens]